MATPFVYFQIKCSERESQPDRVVLAGNPYFLSHHFLVPSVGIEPTSTA